jgi:septum formation topological specificity factor MinE
MKIKISKSQWEMMGKQANWTRTKWEGNTGEANANIAYKKYLDEISLPKLRRDIVSIIALNKVEPINLQIISFNQDEINLLLKYAVYSSIVRKKVEQTMEIIKQEIIELIKKEFKVNDGFKVNIQKA